MSLLYEKLKLAWEKNNSLVCVGLDPELERFPKAVSRTTEPIFAFNKAIIDATADLVCAYKPQFAHYASRAAEAELEKTIAYIKDNYPEAFVILDAKRGDIGSTAKHYAEEAFTRYRADAVTVNPYLGQDSVQPFLAYKDKGVVILCRTSNPGARDIQDLFVGEEKLYQHLARCISEKWNSNRNCLLVVGATYPEELGEIRKIVGDIPFLVPGVGAQGGSVEAAVTKGKTSDGRGLLVSSSRGIIYASQNDDFAEAARAAAKKLRDEINDYR